MGNYAEESVYWYLRLNGFFLIKDFVLHSMGETDILGIRPPFVSEYVEGKRLKEDDLLMKLIKSSGCSLHEHFACIIGEIKGGTSLISKSEMEKKFGFEKLKYNIRRLGLFKENIIEPIAEKLEGAKWFTQEDYATIHKILFANKCQIKPAHCSDFSLIELENVRNFMEKRMNLKFKEGDWNHFDSTMIQEAIMNRFFRKTKINRA